MDVKARTQLLKRRQKKKRNQVPSAQTSFYLRKEKAIFREEAESRRSKLNAFNDGSCKDRKKKNTLEKDSSVIINSSSPFCGGNAPADEQLTPQTHNVKCENVPTTKSEKDVHTQKTYIQGY